MLSANRGPPSARTRNLELRKTLRGKRKAESGLSGRSHHRIHLSAGPLRTTTPDQGRRSAFRGS
jgi:hypothetical protein